MGSVTRDRLAGHRLQHAEVHDDDDRDECPQQHQELALRDQIGLAGLVNQFGDLAHGAMHGQVLQLHVNRQAEAEPESAKQKADQQEPMAIDRVVRKLTDERSGSFRAASPPPASSAGWANALAGRSETSWSPERRMLSQSPRLADAKCAVNVRIINSPRSVSLRDSRCVFAPGRWGPPRVSRKANRPHRISDHASTAKH